MIKLNYRHSLQTMRKELERNNETLLFYYQNAKPVYQVLETGSSFDNPTRTCAFFYNASDIAEYINKRNGLI
jgi:hypothetical protein